MLVERDFVRAIVPIAAGPVSALPRAGDPQTGRVRCGWSTATPSKRAECGFDCTVSTRRRALSVAGRRHHRLTPSSFRPRPRCGWLNAGKPSTSIVRWYGACASLALVYQRAGFRLLVPGIGSGSCERCSAFDIEDMAHPGRAGLGDVQAKGGFRQHGGAVVHSAGPQPLPAPAVGPG